MDAKNEKKTERDEILALAENTKYYTDLLIQQSDSWLSEEEGRKNVEEKRKKEKSRRISRFFLFCLFFAIWQLQAQTTLTVTERIKLYEQEIAEGKVDEIKMLKNYIDLITLFSHIDFEKTLFYFHEAVAYAQEKNQLDWESAYWRRLASAYYELGKIDSSYYCIDRAIELVEGKGYDYEQCANFQVRGAAFFYGQEYEKALNAYLKALELNEKDKARKIEAKENTHNNLGIEASTYRFIAQIYIKLLNYEQAIDYLLRAKKIMDDNPTERIAFIYFQIELHGELAEVYLTTGQPEKALPLLVSSYELAVEKGLLPEVVNGLCRLSNFYITERKDFNQALTFTKEALQIAEKTGMPYLVSFAERTMMKVNFGKKDYQSAVQYAGRALSNIEKEDWDNLQEVYGHLIMIYALLGDASLSEAYLTKYHEAVAKISDKNLHNSLQEMEVKYNVQQKDLELERRQSVISRQKTRQYLLSGGLSGAILLLALLVYIVRLHRRRNRELAETNATKDKFFSIISHDLKTPAVAQRDALQLLLENSDKWDAASLTNYYKKLLKSANGQVDLLYTLLNWAQLQTGRMPYNPTLFDLTTALQSCIGIINSMAENKSVTFDVQTPETALVTGDYNMLTTVVRNLLVNAVKFTPCRRNGDADH